MNFTQWIVTPITKIFNFKVNNAKLTKAKVKGTLGDYLGIKEY